VGQLQQRVLGPSGPTAIAGEDIGKGFGEYPSGTLHGNAEEAPGSNQQLDWPAESGQVPNPTPVTAVNTLAVDPAGRARYEAANR
jgi:hypothetical protein